LLSEASILEACVALAYMHQLYLHLISTLLVAQVASPATTTATYSSKARLLWNEK
jgi:hypothetical protein